MVRAVGYRLRCMLRSHWPATAGLTLIVAVVSAVVLTFAAGARRTSSAPDRFTAAVGGQFDGLIYQDHGRPRTTEIAALPGASSAASITFVFGGLAKGNADVDALVFAGTYDANGRRLVSGRAPRTDSDEFVASRSFIEETNASIGDTFDLVTLTQEQADSSGFDTPNPGGPRLRGVLVGVVDGPLPSTTPRLSPSFRCPCSTIRPWASRPRSRRSGSPRASTSTRSGRSWTRCRTVRCSASNGRKSSAHRYGTRSRRRRSDSGRSPAWPRSPPSPPSVS